MGDVSSAHTHDHSHSHSHGHDHGHKPHVHDHAPQNCFACEHATAASQLKGEALSLHDDDKVAALRGAETYEDRVALGKALSWQLRYRDAIEAYDSAIALDPNRLEAVRLRAGRYLTTLQPEKAIPEFQRCRTLGGDEMDLSYNIGLAQYYAGEDAAAMEAFSACYPLCDDEMGIAAIFWHTLSAWRSGKVPTLLKNYHPGMQVGHHSAYDKVMALASGNLELTTILKLLAQEEADLEYSILAYGVYSYLRHMREDEQASALFEELLTRDGFWPCFAYLAAYNDAMKQNL